MHNVPIRISHPHPQTRILRVRSHSHQSIVCTISPIGKPLRRL
jgi:hypothetical protein